MENQKLMGEDLTDIVNETFDFMLSKLRKRQDAITATDVYSVCISIFGKCILSISENQDAEEEMQTAAKWLKILLEKNFRKRKEQFLKEDDK